MIGYGNEAFIASKNFLIYVHFLGEKLNSGIKILTQLMHDYSFHLCTYVHSERILASCFSILYNPES